MATWPTSVATDAILYIAVNLTQSTLAGTINSIVTTITLASTTGFPTAGAVTIDNEVIFYTGISGADLTGCTRGSDGTTAASHASGVPVGATVVAAHHNLLKNEIIALESSLNFATSLAVVTNGSGRLVVSAVTATELGYLSGVTSAIQTQLGTKAPLASPTFTGTVTIPTPFTLGAVSVTATGTELNYVAGVTSAIQTQLNTKATDSLVVHLAGTESITGSKTFTSPILAPVGSSGAPGITFAGTNMQDNGMYLTGSSPTESLGFACRGVAIMASNSAQVSIDVTLNAKGTSTNDSAATGYYGEVVESAVTNVASGTTGVWADMTSISLTAGDWLVDALVVYAQTSAGTLSENTSGISSTSGNSNTGLVLGNTLVENPPTSVNYNSSGTISAKHIQLAGTTTYYLKHRYDFSSGAYASYGRITAHRIR